ncbi:MAG: tyrosine--tRNA ligase [bacterium]|nr:tyrosine--tRNA ligase [bacterium]
MTLSEELLWRGFVQQTTYDELEELDETVPKFYMGFDASADSQAIGNLAGMMFAKTFMRHGCDATLLAGGSTSLIGDPGGKDAERPMQNEETININIENAKAELRRVFKGHDFNLVNNLDWTKNLSVLTYLRDIGKHFSMTPLIQRDYIAQRIGEGGAGISYTEFSYGLLQALDYLHLYDTHGVTLQLGGSDQWGNCLGGVELIRKARGATAHVITLPLVINKSTGKKFGKSEDGAVWLDSKKTSPYKFYQFWINVDDEGVEDYLKIYTELDRDSIEELIRQHLEHPGSRVAQKRLALEVTSIVHGAARAESVQKVTEVLFGGLEYDSLSKEDINQLEHELTTVTANYGTELADLLVATNLASSKSEAKRFLKASAVYINGYQFSSEKDHIDKEDSLHGFAIIRRGKNANALVKFL